METMTTSSAVDPRKQTVDDDHYDEFLRLTREHFDAVTSKHKVLFTTDADVDVEVSYGALWEAYLAGAPEASRQSRNCNTCRRFITRYGGLVAIDEDGVTRPAIWRTDVVPHYRESASSLARIVGRARVTGVFVSAEPVWGTAYNRAVDKAGQAIEWEHTSVVPPSEMVWGGDRAKLLNAGQEMARLVEEHGILTRGIAEFPRKLVEQALAVLGTEQLYRSEKVLGVARWLFDLHTRIASTLNKRHIENMIWRAVATAPPGFCHVRSTMIGTLLEDLAGAETVLARTQPELRTEALRRSLFAGVKERFDKKMNPTTYQRPTAAPSTGSIAAAEKLVETLGIARSLERRFAKVEDCVTIWTPKAAAPETIGAEGGVFGHLKPKEATAAPYLALPTTLITWSKFAATVLPTAEKIEYITSGENRSYAALITAAHADAPPILQWDRMDRRNPVAWYVHKDGSPPHRWNLVPLQYREVTAVVPQPTGWDPERVFTHHGDSVFLLLKDCRPLDYERGGGHFPENMRGDLHGISAVIEAYAKYAVIAGKDEATACGLRLQKGTALRAQLKVTSRNLTAIYQIDRWD